MAKAKKGKQRLDRFYHLAKEQGYRSRAAFKLLQLDSKFRFLDRAHSVLDLCAAPGGWIQVAVKRMPVGGLVIGVDLVPIRPVRGALTLQGDISTSQCAANIDKILKQNQTFTVDVVLHDGSPNIGGAWPKEAALQSSLVLNALELATKFLAPNKGTFVTKIFRSQDYSSILYALNMVFEKVEATKPVASRNTSAEIYVVCQKLKSAEIDPRFLKARHLFEEIPEAPKVVDVLRTSKQKRHRDGYDDPRTTFRKSCTASAFIWSDKPLELLGSVTSISFDYPSSGAIVEHAETTEEVKALCDDLQVIGKKEFKQILRWRLHLRKALTEPGKQVSGENQSPDHVDDEDNIALRNMEELTVIMDSKMKAARKKAAKRKQKLGARTRTGMQADVMGNDYGDSELFSLASIKCKKDLSRVNESESEESENGTEVQHTLSVDDETDADAEHGRYNAELEAFLDRAYDRYLSRKEGKTAHRKRARMGDSNVWQEDGVTEEMTSSLEPRDEDNRESNPLLVTLPESKLSKEAVARQWYSQEIFGALDEGYGTGNVNTSQSLKKPVSSRRGSEDFEVVPGEDSSDSEYDSDTKAEVLAYASKMLHKKSRDEIVDDAYNRYMFDDADQLPRWFVDDEKKHCQIQRPFTKEEVSAMKAQFKTINARPVKKVAEAKARKKRKAIKCMERARSKAAGIADQPDMSTKSKNRMMEKLYKRAAASLKRPRRELVVARKGSKGTNVRAGRNKLLVDRRMKKDKRRSGFRV